jgi:hydrogenase maturation protease
MPFRERDRGAARMSFINPSATLVAGIGNVLRGDDGFGVEVVNRLIARRRLDGVAEVVDYGIRGLDLVYALLDQRDLVLLVDVARRDRPPGTLFTIDIDTQTRALATLETHNMDPAKVVNMARSLGGPEVKTLLVACEPLVMLDDQTDDVLMELSPPVAWAVEAAVELIENILLPRSVPATQTRNPGSHSTPPLCGETEKSHVG